MCKHVHNALNPVIISNTMNLDRFLTSTHTLILFISRARQSSSLEGFAPSSDGEDERRRRIEREKTDDQWWVSMLLLTEKTRDDGGDTRRSEKVVVLGGGFRSFLCHGEEEKTRTKTEDRWWVSIGGGFRSFPCHGEDDKRRTKTGDRWWRSGGGFRSRSVSSLPLSRRRRQDENEAGGSVVGFDRDQFRSRSVSLLRLVCDGEHEKTRRQKRKERHKRK
ncbi:hypothetical protein YC2023_099736 [Brassica napus]